MDTTRSKLPFLRSLFIISRQKYLNISLIIKIIKLINQLLTSRVWFNLKLNSFKNHNNFSGFGGNPKKLLENE